MLDARGDMDAALNQMRDWQRNIPTLAADFEFDVEQVSANIAVLNGQNSDIKADIVCLEEEKKSLQLLSDLEDARIEDAEFDLELLKTKEKHVMQELTDFIERGDTLYSELRKVVTEQAESERDLSKQFNDLAHRQSMHVRSKLNYNKADFERLRRLGQTKGGAMGKELERMVQGSDKLKLDIVAAKKDAHRGLVDIRDVMKCDIGKEQREHRHDFRQVDRLLGLLGAKDVEHLRELCSAKDSSEKEYLASQVANGLRDIMAGDKVDIEQHIDFNNSGMEKLQKMLAQHADLKEKQGEIFASQVKTKQSMRD